MMMIGIRDLIRNIFQGIIAELLMIFKSN